MEIAQPMTYVEIEPGLPPLGYGGVVPLVDLLAGEVRAELEHPELLLLDQDTPAPGPLRAKVHAAPSEWALIVRECIRRGVMREIPYDDIYRHQGEPVLNGAFGVLKKGKVNAEGGRVLRLIMNLIPSNSLQRMIGGDVEELAGPMAWLPIHLDDGEQILFYGDDLVCSFYLFSLPPAWLPLMAFSQSVPRGSLDGSSSREPVFVACAVVAMGWISAVGLLQHAVRRTCLRARPLGAQLPADREVTRGSFFPHDFRIGPREFWSVYLDDLTFAKVIQNLCWGHDG